MADSPGAEPIRLAKRVAAQLSCSRSDAENFIAGGWVRVNGHVQESPQSRVGERDVVEVDPKARLEALAPVTLLWHKPAGVAMPEDSAMPTTWVEQHLGAATRWSGDRSGVRWLKAHAQQLHWDPTEHSRQGKHTHQRCPTIAQWLVVDFFCPRQVHQTKKLSKQLHDPTVCATCLNV